MISKTVFLSSDVISTSTFQCNASIGIWRVDSKLVAKSIDLKKGLNCTQAMGLFLRRFLLTRRGHGVLGIADHRFDELGAAKSHGR